MKRFFKFLYRNLHWLLTGFLLIYTVLPFLSPVFLKYGPERAGWYIQTIYRFTCHQRAERSFFLFGENFTYSLTELRFNGYEGDLSGFPFVGNEEIGYKVAFCTRDVALYGSMAVAGFIVSLRKKKLSIPWWALAIGAVPMILDGGVQFISEFIFISQESLGLQLAKPWYLSNNETRTITGMLFGLSLGLFLFSEIRSALAETLRASETTG
ncbi:MAG: DUF2085 domain-containing protein [Candidatus Dojkabacteria bacterium]|nr:DUF2085 domain-containing protein [Candidatus Dojkabacteria bacterium]